MWGLLEYVSEVIGILTFQSKQQPRLSYYGIDVEVLFWKTIWTNWEDICRKPLK